MERWNIIPSQWDRLNQYDQAFMMAFIDAEAEISNANVTSGKSTFIVGLGLED